MALSNSSAKVAQLYRYDAFGRMTQSGSVVQPYTYTAREYDTETGLYYYRARYYDPKAGRFITRDPIGFRGGINQYAYVSNNPVNRIDPWGHYETLFGDTECRKYWALGGWGLWHMFEGAGLIGAGLTAPWGLIEFGPGAIAAGYATISPGFFAGGYFLIRAGKYDYAEAMSIIMQKCTRK